MVGGGGERGVEGVRTHQLILFVSKFLVLAYLV